MLIVHVLFNTMMLDVPRAQSHNNFLTNLELCPLWLRFAAATILMKTWFNNDPERLRSTAFVNTYTKRRKDGLLFGFDDSTYKVGKQLTRNWCGSVLLEVKVPWTNEVFSKDKQEQF